MPRTSAPANTTALPRTLRYAILIATGFGFCVSILMQWIAEPVVGLFTTDAVVVVAGGQYIRGYIWDCLFAGIHFSFSGYFCAYGRSEISFLHNICAILLMRIPGVYLMSGALPRHAAAHGPGHRLRLCALGAHLCGRLPLPQTARLFQRCRRAGLIPAR